MQRSENAMRTSGKVQPQNWDRWRFQEGASAEAVNEYPEPTLRTTTSLAESAIANSARKHNSDEVLPSSEAASTTSGEIIKLSSESETGETDEIASFRNAEKLEIFSQMGESRLQRCLARWKADRILYFLPDSPDIFSVETHQLHGHHNAPEPSHHILKEIYKLYAALRNKNALRKERSPISQGDSAGSSTSSEESSLSNSRVVITVVIPVRPEWDLSVRNLVLNKWQKSINHFCYCHEHAKSGQLNPKTPNDPHINVACGTLLQHPFFYESSNPNHSDKHLRNPHFLSRVNRNEGFDLVIADFSSCFCHLDPCCGLALLFDSLRQSIRAGGTLWLSGSLHRDFESHGISSGQLHRHCFEWTLEAGLLTEKLKFCFVDSTSLFGILLATNPVSVMIREAHALKHIKPSVDYVGFGCSKGKTERFVEPFRKVLRRCGIQSFDIIRDTETCRKLERNNDLRATLMVKSEEDSFLSRLGLPLQLTDNVNLFDSLEASRALCSRPAMLAYLRSALPSFSDAHFICPKSTIISDAFTDETSAAAWLSKSRILLPAVVKPVQANIHDPFFDIREAGELTAHSLFRYRRSLPTPALIQSMVEHKHTQENCGAVSTIWKVSVIYNRFTVALRASLDATQKYDSDRLSRVSKFPPCHVPDRPLDKRTLHLFGRLAATMRKRLDLKLFNLDVIETPEQHSNIRCFSVVDLNYWPGFSETPNKLALLADALCHKDWHMSSEAPLLSTCTPPPVDLWNCLKLSRREVSQDAIEAGHESKVGEPSGFETAQLKFDRQVLPTLLESKETKESDSVLKSSASSGSLPGSSPEGDLERCSQDQKSRQLSEYQENEKCSYLSTKAIEKNSYATTVVVISAIGIGSYMVYRWIKSRKR